MSRQHDFLIFRRLAEASVPDVERLNRHLPGVLAMGRMSYHLTQFRSGNAPLDAAERQAIFHPQPDTATQPMTLRVAGAAIINANSDLPPYLILNLHDPARACQAERYVYAKRAGQTPGRFHQPHLSILRVSSDTGVQKQLLKEVRERIEPGTELTFDPVESIPVVRDSPDGQSVPSAHSPHQALIAALRRSFQAQKATDATPPLAG